MSKVSKARAKAHHEAERILTKDRLTEDERAFVFDNWTPRASHLVAVSGTFFTPEGLARDLTVFGHCGGHTLDLCAGIGRLAYWHLRQEPEAPVTCIELNPAFVEIGRKLVPEARWIQGDVFERSTYDDVPEAAHFLSNPPFGRPRGYDAAAAKWAGGAGLPADLAALAVGFTLCGQGSMILPTGSCPFEYGARGYREREPVRNVEKLAKAHPFLLMNCLPIETEHYKDEWDGASPSVLAVDVATDLYAKHEAEEAAREAARAEDLPTLDTLRTYYREGDVWEHEHTNEETGKVVRRWLTIRNVGATKIDAVDEHGEPYALSFPRACDLTYAQPWRIRYAVKGRPYSVCMSKSSEPAVEPAPVEPAPEPQPTRYTQLCDDNPLFSSVAQIEMF